MTVFNLQAPSRMRSPAGGCRNQPARSKANAARTVVSASCPTMLALRRFAFRLMVSALVSIATLTSWTVILLMTVHWRFVSLITNQSCALPQRIPTTTDSFHIIYARALTELMDLSVFEWTRISSTTVIWVCLSFIACDRDVEPLHTWVT